MEYLFSGGSILLAALGFGFVIFVHELGHFVFAKLAGVRVDVFSIGFPPTVWSKTLGETRYAIGALPFGGYVKMLGQDDAPAKEAGDADDPRSYANKHRLWRGVILLGGVLFNLISAYLLLLILCWTGMPYTPPRVAGIQERIPTVVEGRRRTVDSPARRLDLRPGDRVVAVDDDAVYAFEDISLATITAGDEPMRITVVRDGEELRLPATGDPPVRPVYDRREGRPVLGVQPPRDRRVYRVSPNPFGIEPGWTIEAVDGRSVADGYAAEVERVLAPRVGATVTVTFATGDGGTVTERFRYAGPNASWGAYGLPQQIIAIAPDGAAAETAMRPGDVIRTVDGVAVESFAHLVALTQAAGQTGRTVEICLARRRPDGNTWEWLTVRMRPRRDERRDRWLLGVTPDDYTVGPLPPLSPTVAGEENPLLRAGLPEDACLFDLRRTAERGDTAGGGSGDRQRVRLLAITGGRYDRLVLSDAARQALLAGDPSLRDRLVGFRVTSTGPEHLGHPEPDCLQVEDADGKRRDPIHLAPLEPADRKALLSLEAGDWILGFSSLDGDLLLHYLRGSPHRPQRIGVAQAETGVVLDWGAMAAYEPFPLEDWTQAFTLANHFSRQMIGKTLAIIPRFFVSGEEGGLDSDKSLSGPLGIFVVLQQSSRNIGLDFFLKLVALISLNLVLINLLPIPITDGGQLLFLGIEAVIRRPLPVKVQNVAAILGIALVVLLMLYTLRLDLGRIFGL